MAVALDSKVPDFTAAASGGDFTLSAQRGKTVVLYFYPKDNTPGCTTEGRTSPTPMQSSSEQMHW